MRPIRKILFITLSNIGDCIMTLPVFDAIKRKYPQALVTVFCGPRPKGLFEHNPAVNDLIIYDKRQTIGEKIRLVRYLASQKYDLIVDLRNSLLGLLLPAAMRFWHRPSGKPAVVHMKDRHCSVIEPLRLDGAGVIYGATLSVSEADNKAAGELLKKAGLGATDKIVIVSAGSRSTIKRWQKEKFAQLIDKLIEQYRVRVVLIGDQDDVAISGFIVKQCAHPIVDLTAKTTLLQTVALLKRGSLLITNDSANLHLASYLKGPVVALFGPTDDQKYGPWSQQSAIIKKEIFCRPCSKAQCRFGTLSCMHLITVEDVLRRVGSFLSSAANNVERQQQPSFEYKRILVVRTDRMGDLILSTPVLKEIRMKYPNAYLAVFVRPYTKAVVEGNPYVDEVIVYDKKEYDANIVKFFGFISCLRRRNFDLALVLHPTTRDHLIVFLSGIRRRIGYSRKMGFLLTDRMVHDKQQGKKHESDYALDMVRLLGIEPKEKELFVPTDKKSEQWAQEFLSSAAIKPAERVVIINPGASCPSKIWPVERYAAAADALAAQGCKIIVLAGPDSLDSDTARAVIKHMKAKAIDCIGTVPIPETASLFRQAAVVISADTGPMHIAAAVGVPLVAIFGRNQPGISPRRWGPENPNSVVLHKDVGCAQCRAHDCIKGFACLAAITVDEVIVAAKTLMRQSKK